jgi:hypothetical protein
LACRRGKVIIGFFALLSQKLHLQPIEAGWQLVGMFWAKHTDELGKTRRGVAQFPGGFCPKERQVLNPSYCSIFESLRRACYGQLKHTAR